MKRFVPWLPVIVGLLVVATVLRQCSNGGAASYQTATITRGPITQAVTATGTLNPVVTVQVGSQVSGNIAKLFVDFNSEVKAGQVVAQIDPALFQAAVTQAEGDLANAQATLELAKVNAKRTQELFAKKTSSQADVDQAMATLHQSEANVKIKQGALDKVRTDLEHCNITSPIDGVVISRSVDVGQTVAASLQAPIIFAIANDLTKMQIDANVAEEIDRLLTPVFDDLEVLLRQIGDWIALVVSNDDVHADEIDPGTEGRATLRWRRATLRRRRIL